MIYKHFIPKIALCTLFFLLCGSLSAQLKGNHSKIVKIAEHEYKLDCSGYIYQFKQKPSFVGGKGQIERLLFNELRYAAITQTGFGGDCKMTIRLFPDGHIQLLDVSLGKGGSEDKIEAAMRRIFLDQKRWVPPVFIDGRKVPIDILIGVHLFTRRISYRIESLLTDACESKIYSSPFDIWLWVY